MVKIANGFSSFLFYYSSAIGRMAHWPVKTKPQRVFTGLWKLCGILETNNSQRPITGKLGGKILPL
jgi:hypothetical protein